MNRIIIAFASSVMLLGLVGCQNSADPTSSVSAGPQRALIISGGQGPATAVYLPGSDREHVVMLSTSGAKECPDCEAAAVKYFQTGELVTKCPTCGATRTPVATYQFVGSHN